MCDTPKLHITLTTTSFSRDDQNAEQQVRTEGKMNGTRYGAILKENLLE